MKVVDLLKRIVASVFIVVGVNGLLYEDNVFFYSIFTAVAVYMFIFVPKSGKDHGDSSDLGDSDGGD
ncbi:MAG: hypothetical protein GY787_20990 [Alteromonadales bacterium]|nr:hypothetical protein [Alteromonadales bacterium]